MKMENKKPRLRFAVGSALLIIVCTYLWGFQTVATFKFRQLAKKEPILRVTPRLLRQTEVNHTQGIKLSHRGYEFEVPWSDLETERNRDSEDIAAFVFRSGIGVSFFGPSRKYPELLSDPKIREAFGPVIGRAAAQSNFAFLEARLEASPEQIKPWISRYKAIEISTLLSMKASTMLGGETGLFNIQQNGWRGFQLDDPAKKQKVVLDLFDSRDQRVELIFAVKKGAALTFTQADVNRVVQTLKVTDQGAASRVSSQDNTKTPN